ncbi:hypothetical protein [Nostoc sp.]|uniref:hypothetical protein n=1 Tax=Nostoc sp. TaxID=1180 RepID=UPI002FFAD045
MLSNLAGIVEKGKLVIPYDDQDRLKQLKSKMRFYKLDDKGLATDTVMSLAGREERVIILIMMKRKRQII